MLYIVACMRCLVKISIDIPTTVYIKSDNCKKIQYILNS